MTTAPLVSVVVPAWNSERTLLRTLESVSRQTYRKLEILIVDDGSTDSTAAIAQLFCATESRARLIRTENRGVACARNRGIAEALGDWIAPIDSDDIWHPTKIEKQMRVALAAPEPVGFVYCWYRQVDEQDRLLASGPRLRMAGRTFNRLAYVNPVENGSASLFSRSALLAVGGYDEDLPPYEDVVVQLRIAARYPVDLVPEHLVGWRRHDLNASRDVDLIAARARAMYARLVAEGAPLPHQLVRWAEARNLLDRAEQRMAERRLSAAIACAAGALRRDPARTLLQLLYRSVRFARKQVTASERHAVQPLFTVVDPLKPIATDAFALPRLAALVEKLDSRRLKRLASIELRPTELRRADVPAEFAGAPVAGLDTRESELPRP